MKTYQFEQAYVVYDFYEVKAESEEEARDILKNDMSEYLLGTSEPQALEYTIKNGPYKTELVLVGES